MHDRFMKMAISLALDGIEKGHGPFGAVIVKGDVVVGTGTNRVTSSNDPTAHAEVCAIRNACEGLKNFSLKGCAIYTSCEPCPMCLAAIYWSRLDRIYYGATRADAAKINFDDQHIYEEINKPLTARALPITQVLHDDALLVFAKWSAFDARTNY